MNRDSDIYAIPVLVGPTGVGKTDVGTELAQRIGAEVISADSRQVYRYMDIGTAKPTLEEQIRAKHHLINLVNPDARFSAGEYSRRARDVIHKLTERKVPFLVVGGAGLYIKTLTEGHFEAPEIPLDLRKELEIGYRTQTTIALHNRLTQIDPSSARIIHVNDRRRIERALEIHDATGIPRTAWFNKPKVRRPQQMFLIGLRRERCALYARINQRVNQMIESGFEDEVRSLMGRGYGDKAHAMSTFGYSEMLRYIKGEMNIENTVSVIQQRSRQYAKRQLTWFRKMGIKWISLPEGEDPEETCERIVQEYPSLLF
jgi:tRNA dimethylallyltransferase